MFELQDPDDAARFEDHISAKQWKKAYSLLAEPQGQGSEIKLRFLLKYKEQIPPYEYGSMLYDAYVHSYQGLQHLSLAEILSLFDYPDLSYLGSADTSVVDHLNDPLTVYRGYHQASRKLRASWTTDEYNASYFALLWHKEGGDEPRIVKGQIDKSKVIVFISKESEVIVNPEDVVITNDYPVPKDLWVKNGRADEHREWYGEVS